MHREPLDQQSLTDALAPPWQRIDIVPQTGSTNADLLERAASGDDIDGNVLIAEYQTAGRGRNGREWSAVPLSQIAMSVGVNAADVPIAGWGWLPLLTGVAVVDAVAAGTGVQAGLKWPNDVLAGGLKLAGILAEVSANQSVIAVGIGLNVTLLTGDIGLPDATSLLELGVKNLDRTALARRILNELGARIHAWQTYGGADDQLIADYRSRSLTVGSPVRAVLPGDREIVGVARSIDGQGRLLIGPGDSDDTGERSVAVSAGDIVHLRPAP